MSDHERQLIAAIDANAMDKVVQLLAGAPLDDSSSAAVNINAIDENGMSLLQHACYHGNLAIARYLLERGADVNQHDHESGYTALMFAALGGHLGVLTLLLENGARVDATNCVKRTAAQMAAFVGQHQAVAMINNFLPRHFIEYYSRITGLETEPRLPARLVAPVAGLVRGVNIHPVRVALHLTTSTTVFLDEAERITKVLDLLVERLFKQPDPLEMFSLKLHYFNFLYRKVVSYIEEAKKKESSEGKPFDLEKSLGSMFRSWFQLGTKGLSDTCELLLRESIRSYDYQENTLFQQLVRTLSSIQIGEEPSCLAVMSQAILGKSVDGADGGGDGEDQARVCSACHNPEPSNRCAGCRAVYYCNQQCQRIHWIVHKQACAKLKQLMIEWEEKQRSNPADEDEDVEKAATMKGDDEDSSIVIEDKRQPAEI